MLPGVAVAVTNIETGVSRSLVTDGSGHYRALTLPLGSYTVRAELAGFKAVERTGVSLSAGQTALVDVTMEVGGVEEVVTVSAEPPIADPAKIDLGRTINSREIHDLPLLARNPYNFALIQPNVTGFENAEFGATRMNANGTQMRTNYQIDGGSATQKNRAGLRMFQPSEIMVKEVKVITSGFAPEFGQTTGMVFNAISPSGTNAFHGEASYRFPPPELLVVPVPARLRCARQAGHAHRRHHGRHRRPARQGQVALLRRLRVAQERPLLYPHHHGYTSDGGRSGSRPFGHR